MSRHAKRLGAATAIAVLLALAGAGTAAATTATSATVNSISCNMNINKNYTSPRPRLVNWSAAESCNSVIAAIAILQSTLYYDSPSGPFPIAEGSHPTQVPSYQVTSFGSATPSSGGNYHLSLTYQILLDFGQGSWSLAPGCFYYLQGGYTNGLQCTTNSAEFTLLGDPTISQGGVVNGANYRADDIHAGTTVAIFGQWFAPADTVVVTQGGSQYLIQAGSPWWYDSAQQINATLPDTLSPGAATINIVTNAGIVSNTIPINIT